MADEMTKTEDKSQILTLKWDYDTFLTLGKTHFKMLGRAQIELVRILYRAKKELSQQGFRSDKKLYKNNITSCNLARSSDQLHSFEEFCNAVGIAKRTAYFWLEAYDAENDRLMTPEEVKDIKRKALLDAQESRFSAVHDKRSGGEPDYKPEGWTDLEEVMYEQWLVSKGYKQAPNVSLVQNTPPIINKYGQFGLFTDDYLDSISKGCIEKTNGDNAIEFSNLCDRYEKEVPKGLQPRDVMRIPIMVKVALEKLPAEARKDSARLVAEVILAEEVGGNR